MIDAEGSVLILAWGAAARADEPQFAMFLPPPAELCRRGSVRACQAIYEGPELCAALRPLCEVGVQDACAAARSSEECGCLAGEPASCTAFAGWLSVGGDEATRVLTVLEGPCLDGAVAACTAITDHLLRTGQHDRARPWLVFTCDRGVGPACAQLRALPPESPATSDR